MGNGINNGMDSAVKFGAGRYRQGRGVLEHCGQEIRRFGKKAYIVSGPRAFDAVKDRLLPGLTEAGVEFVAEIYDGVCSYEAAEASVKNVWTRDATKWWALEAASSWTCQRQWLEKREWALSISLPPLPPAPPLQP